ncbi:MAG TPA: hypothetical protein VIU15_17505 [Streptomyces sp.]
MGESARQEVWRECLVLGRRLLPLMDEERWRRDSRWEKFQGMGAERGDFLFGVFAGIVFHAVVKDAVAAGSSASVETLDAIPLRDVEEAVRDKPDHELLVGSPAVFADEDEERAVLAIRWCVYARSRQFTVMRGYLEHALHTITGRDSTPTPTCGSLRDTQQGPAPQ